ncbi:MAG: SpoIVB peptidase [Lachnospiraceae bacterium]
MKRFFKYWKWFLPVSVCIVIIFSYSLIVDSIPDQIHIITGKEQNFSFGIPVTGEVADSKAEVFTNQSEKLGSDTLHLNLQKNFSLKSETQGNFSILCKLFGIFSVKKVDVQVVDGEKVIPGGTAIGIYVESDGILILGTGPVTAINGEKKEPALDIVKSGDYILAINGEKIKRKEELIKKINLHGKLYNEKPVIITIRREDQELCKRITPIKTDEGEYRLGIWVRDDLAGIGTLTFITLDGKFGALGHCVSDIDTGKSLQLEKGSIYETLITGINKGKRGTPGELLGLINYKSENRLGSIFKNTEEGIFGTIETSPKSLEKANYLSIAMKEQIKIGSASILSDVSGKRKEYEVMIRNINYADTTGNKGICIEVTDQDLIELTGGIVQGMSGSPIIQNGKLIGAVTHVFIQNPRKGYGAFIENMMAE